MKRILISLVAPLFLLGGCKPQDEPVIAEKVSVPQKVLIYYGWPSAVNVSGGNVSSAVSVFNQFDIIVLGNTLQNTGHPDYTKTLQIIDNLVKNGKKVYGYIPTGNREGDTRFTSEQLKQETDKWKVMGVTGIFADEFEIGYNVDRTRQNVLVDYVHSAGLSVIANGYDVESVLGGKNVKLGAGDYYFLESFGIRYGNHVPIDSTIKRGNLARDYKKKFGTGIISGGRDSNVKLDNSTPGSNKFLHAYYANLLFNFEGFSYSDQDYSASGNNNANVFTIPVVTPFYGNTLKNGKQVIKEGDVYATYTDTHKIILTANSGRLEKQEK